MPQKTTSRLLNKNPIVKNNAIRLPVMLGKRWNNAAVTIIATGSDTLILKRVQKPQKPLGRLAELTRGKRLPRMSRKAVNREIAAYRSKK